MKLTQFKLHIPDSLLATYPAKHRDESRLMVVERKTGKIHHKNSSKFSIILMMET
jgi:S-adenosylmethionine:tRNA ribosyltransferase-isomerase